MQPLVSFPGVGLKPVIRAHRYRLRLALAGAAALLAATLTGAPAHAEGPVEVVTHYEVTIAGVPLGSVKFSGDIDAEGYSLTGSGGSSRLLDLISEVRGRGKSVGGFAGVRVLPASYELKFRTDKGKQSVDMRFDNGAIQQLSVDPPLKQSPSRVPVKESHRVGVIDPLSALVLPLPAGAVDGETACDRRLPIFDGRYRYDLVLSHKRTETAAASGSSGERARLFVCKVKYHPIAGHKPKRKSISYWQDNEDLEVWLAPVAAAHLFVPHRVVAQSRIGPVVLSLSKLKVTERERQAAITPDK